MVEAKIFILYGAANKGKSTTLNTLFNQICWKFSKFLVFFERHGNGLDFVAVFDHESQRIGFYSSGDNEYEVRRNLYKLYSHNCDFIFGTSRTRGGSCDAVGCYAELLHGDVNIINWCEKFEPTDEDNERAVKELFKSFKNIINKL